MIHRPERQRWNLFQTNKLITEKNCKMSAIKKFYPKSLPLIHIQHTRAPTDSSRTGLPETLKSMGNLLLRNMKVTSISNDIPHVSCFHFPAQWVRNLDKKITDPIVLATFWIINSHHKLIVLVIINFLHTRTHTFQIYFDRKTCRFWIASIVQ